LRADRPRWYAALMRDGLSVAYLLALCAVGACSSSSSTGPARTPEAACEASGDAEACAAAAELYFDGGINLPGPRAGRGVHVLDHARSYRYASVACEKGHAFGCALLGYHHQDGLGGAEWSAAKAIAAYEKACAGGAGVGCYNLASMYYGGQGVVADEVRGDAYKAKARAAWEAACRGSGPRWCTNLAFLLREEDAAANRARCLELDQRTCDHQVLIGCTEAARDRAALGRSTSGELDRELGRLCEAGEPTACTLAGSALIGGGITADATRGLALVVRGCEIGDSRGCWLAGSEYATGKVVTADLARADRYIRMACDRALGAACMAVAEDSASRGEHAVAAAFARRACQMGQGEACTMLSQLYLGGQGVAASEPEGVRWATEACRMGHLRGCAELIARDLELPAPPGMKERMYKDACAAGIANACKRASAGSAAAPPI
jgi:TPR repeat protein